MFVAFGYYLVQSTSCLWRGRLIDVSSQFQHPRPQQLNFLVALKIQSFPVFRESMGWGTALNLIPLSCSLEWSNKLFSGFLALPILDA